MGYVHRVGGSLRLFLVGPEMSHLLSTTEQYRGCSEKRNEDQKTAGQWWREIHLFRKNFITSYNNKLENVS